MVLLLIGWKSGASFSVKPVMSSVTCDQASPFFRGGKKNRDAWSQVMSSVVDAKLITFQHSNETTFYDNSTNSRALIGWFLSSISGQTHEFIIYAMRQRARADNLTVCYRKKQMDVSFSCVCPVIDNEFRHNIVKVVCGFSYFDNVYMTKFMIHNRTAAWKTDVHLLNRQWSSQRNTDLSSDFIRRTHSLCPDQFTK